MATVEIGSTWKRAGRLGIYEVDRLNASQARLRNVKTRRTEWVGLSRLCENWQRIDAPAAPPAHQSALEMVRSVFERVMRGETVPQHEGAAAFNAISALVSEVREDCARIADNESEVWAGASANMESSGRTNDGAVAAMVIARRIRERNG